MAKGKKLKQYVYIVQASLEPAKCKIGITNDLKRRLKEYNSMTGKSKYNIYTYLFSCEVKDMNQLETDIKTEFQRMREVRNKEIYFYNDDLFKDYVTYIKSHKLFIKQIEIKSENKIQEVKIIKRTKPSLEERGMSYKAVMQKAKNVDFDEFFTRYEDIEKEIEMYDNKIWKLNNGKR
jgi:predicted GIY-YIG superfamily endonuclease